MADLNFEKALQFVLKREGGYVNDPLDKGGETNKGITHGTYNEYRKSKGLPVQSVKNITDTEVKDIYYSRYWLRAGCDKISNPKLAIVMFDTAVNMGVGRSGKLLASSKGDFETFLKQRQNTYHQFVAYDATQKRFLQGWTNRVNELRKYADSLGV